MSYVISICWRKLLLACSSVIIQVNKWFGHGKRSHRKILFKKYKHVHLIQACIYFIFFSKEAFDFVMVTLHPLLIIVQQWQTIVFSFFKSIKVFNKWWKHHHFSSEKCQFERHELSVFTHRYVNAMKIAVEWNLHVIVKETDLQQCLNN